MILASRSVSPRGAGDRSSQEAIMRRDTSTETLVKLKRFRRRRKVTARNASPDMTAQGTAGSATTGAPPTGP